MVQVINPELEIDIQLQFYAKSERNPANYFAWIKDPIYQDIHAKGDSPCAFRNLLLFLYIKYKSSL